MTFSWFSLQWVPCLMRCQIVKCYIQTQKMTTVVKNMVGNRRRWIIKGQLFISKIQEEIRDGTTDVIQCFDRHPTTCHLCNHDYIPHPRCHSHDYDHIPQAATNDHDPILQAATNGIITTSHKLPPMWSWPHPTSFPHVIMDHIPQAATHVIMTTSHKLPPCDHGPHPTSCHPCDHGPHPTSCHPCDHNQIPQAATQVIMTTSHKLPPMWLWPHPTSCHQCDHDHIPQAASNVIMTTSHKLPPIWLSVLLDCRLFGLSLERSMKEHLYPIHLTLCSEVN